MERLWEEIVRGRGFSFLRLGLRLLSWPFEGVVRTRRWLYDKRLLPVHRVGVPVVSIGNLVVGGSGKTPFTLFLASRLMKQWRVGVISRGYASLAEKQARPTLVSRGQGPLCEAAVGGDEAVLIAKRLPEVIVVSGRDRVAGAKLAIESGATLLLLEDGMQHRRCARDFECVVLPKDDPLGGSKLLPAGKLREPLSSLGRADLLVVEEGTDLGGVERFTSAPCLKVCGKVGGVFTLENQEMILSPGEKVGIFCAIAHPERFSDTVEKLGLQVVARKYFSDHRLGSVEAFLHHCQKVGVQKVLCTEKDRVKLASSISEVVPIGWVKWDLEMTAGEEFLSTLCKRMNEKGSV